MKIRFFSLMQSKYIEVYILIYFLPFCRSSFQMIISFVLQQLFSLIWSHLFIFIFVVCALGVLFTKSLPRTMSRIFLSLYFILEGLQFQVLHLSLWSFYFCETCKIGVQFISFAYGYSVSPASLIETAFPIVYSCHLC